MEGGLKTTVCVFFFEQSYELDKLEQIGGECEAVWKQTVVNWEVKMVQGICYLFELCYSS